MEGFPARITVEPWVARRLGNEEGDDAIDGLIGYVMIWRGKAISGHMELIAADDIKSIEHLPGYGQ